MYKRGILCHFFFAFCASFFAFCVSQHFARGEHLREKSKDFLVYFFAALIKHEMRMKYKKCIVDVSYFVVCFAKTFAKYPWNVKYKKCIAGLRLILELTITFTPVSRGCNQCNAPAAIFLPFIFFQPLFGLP